MEKIKIIFVVLFFVSIALCKTHYKAILEGIFNSRNNLFTIINKDIRSAINKIFTTLKLANISSSPEVRPFLGLHYDLINIAENNFDIYSEMRNIATVYDRDKAVDKINLTEIISESLQEMYYNINKSTTIKPTFLLRTQKAANTAAASTVPEPEFKNSQELDQFAGDFVAKINTISAKDFLRNMHDHASLEYYDDMDRNIKAWVPPNNMELDVTNNVTNRSRRIFGGRRTLITKYPFVVSMWMQDLFICAGSIISKDLVITAASCLQIAYNNRFFRENPRSTGVRVGSDYTDRHGEYIPINEIYFHPSYNPRTLYSNLAIVRLQRQLQLKGKSRRIRRIELDDVAENMPVDTNGIYTLGWGARKPANIPEMFQQLMVHRLDIYFLKACQEVYSPQFVTEKNFCAGFLSVGGGACNKDVGGPGVVGKKLVGVISFGSPVCGAVDSPTVFTRVGHYIKWINKVMAMDAPVRKLKTTTDKSWTGHYPFLQRTTRTPNPIVPVISDVTPRVELTEYTTSYLRSKKEKVTAPNAPENVSVIIKKEVEDKKSFLRARKDKEILKSLSHILRASISDNEEDTEYESKEQKAVNGILDASNEVIKVPSKVTKVTSDINEVLSKVYTAPRKAIKASIKGTKIPSRVTKLDHSLKHTDIEMAKDDYSDNYED